MVGLYEAVVGHLETVGGRTLVVARHGRAAIASACMTGQAAVGTGIGNQNMSVGMGGKLNKRMVLCMGVA
jgi:hypothetical protein